MTENNKVDNLEQELTVPEKYKGKSITDVVKMHQEVEQALSRQGQELGETRRLVNTLIEAGNKTKEPERPQVTTETLLAEPDKVLDSAIESHPAVKRAQETADILEKQVAQVNFEKAHPSYQQDLTDPEFATWVRSNRGLMKLAAEADAYNFDSAEALWSLWDERKTLAKQVKDKAAADQKRKEAERAGTLEGSSGADASDETIYSRAEIQDLHRRALLGDLKAKAKREDPKFKALIDKAYKEGRVR
jgi:hypothetical protein